MTVAQRPPGVTPRAVIARSIMSAPQQVQRRAVPGYRLASPPAGACQTSRKSATISPPAPPRSPHPPSPRAGPRIPACASPANASRALLPALRAFRLLPRAGTAAATGTRSRCTRTVTNPRSCQARDVRRWQISRSANFAPFWNPTGPDSRADDGHPGGDQASPGQDRGDAEQHLAEVSVARPDHLG
jgi:hypothetical protein